MIDEQTPFQYQEEEPASVALYGNVSRRREGRRDLLFFLAVAMFACVIVPVGAVALTCVTPYFDVKCSQMGQWVDATVSDWHPEGHNCEHCRRVREGRKTP
jgi:hypothetical protein